MPKNMPLGRPYFDEQEIRAIRRVLKSGWVTQGPAVREFEERISSYIGVKHAICVSNCTAALHLALLAAGVKKGDEVIVSDYTYPATAHAVMYCGAVPVFADIDIKTYNIDPDLIASLITPRTKAIIPVHVFGRPAPMGRIKKIAIKYGLSVIEDAACALGAGTKEGMCGAIGDIGCFSLHGRKGITTGEGGIIVTNDDNAANYMRSLACFGTERKERPGSKFSIPSFTYLGYNYKLSDINAAIGIAQFDKLEKIIKKKRQLASYLDKKIKRMELITAPLADKDAGHIYQSYVVLLHKSVDRDSVVEIMARTGFHTNIGTFACHVQPVYGSKCVCPHSSSMFEHALALPFYYEMEKSDIDRMVPALAFAIEEATDA